jgi:O-antigen/teichoic acid export membrane protein
MSLIPRQADPSLVAFRDEVDVAAALVADDTTEVRQLASVDSRLSEDSRRRRWWRLGSYIDRVRTDSLLRNSLFIMATPLLISAVGYVFWLLAAHLYSASAVGLTAAITSASSIVMNLSCIGVCGTLIQTLPERPKEPGWSTTFWSGMATAVSFAVALSGIALVVLPLFSPKLIELRSVDYAAVFAIGTVALAACTTLDYVFIAERRAGDLFSRNSAAAGVKLLVIGLLGLAAGSGTLRLLGAWGAASVFGLGLGAALLVRHRRVARPPGLSVLVRTALGFRSRVTGHQAIGMSAGLLSSLLPLLVTVRLSPSDNAYFFTTWMMAELLFGVLAAVSTSLFAEGMHRHDELGALTRSAFRILGAILVPGSVAVLAMGGTLLSTLGPAYADHGVGLLRIAAVSSIPAAVICVYGGVLRAQGRLTTLALLYLGISTGTLVMSWLLLPVIGISAVGWAFMAMQLCGCVYVVLDRRKQALPKRPQHGIGAVRRLFS